MKEIKTIDLYLASSIGDSVGTFSALLVYKNNGKMIYGTYDGFKLIESLLLGLSESLALLKEKCNVKVNILSNNIVKILMKSKATINDIVRNSTVEQVSKHNIEFILLKEDDINRIVLDRVKRHSKSIISNEIRNKIFVEVINCEYYFRQKEISSSKLQSNFIVSDNFNYLDGLTDNTKEWIIMIINTFDLNLYHSAAATIEANIKKKSIVEVTEGYIEKNISKRSYIIGNEEKIKEIFEYVYDRLSKKNKNWE